MKTVHMIHTSRNIEQPGRFLFTSFLQSKYNIFSGIPKLDVVLVEIIIELKSKGVSISIRLMLFIGSNIEPRSLLFISNIIF